MFNKILIANRGEIACRIIRSCQNLGISTVAVYSEPDRNALHVGLADEAWPVGEAPPQQSYLDIDKILEAARASGADAIHPGYGFLSENPAFARRCQDAGIRFIGPTPEVMEKMGDKLRARKLAKKAGLPVLPGTDQAVEDDEAEECAWKLGFPLMVKALEGGGGIGIHIIESMEGLTQIMQRTRQVAKSAFGSPRLFFERNLKDASHIEVQIIGDEHGNLIHLFERDCSVQRRHQKLIEESPAVKLDPKLRRRLCKLALKLARHIGYTNAGTVEFLVAPDGQAYFTEMNTRLQVEHGVTEMVTGVDLVELQIRVAAGESLPVAQEDIKVTGHAIQARVYPEDPATLMPQIGTVTDYHQPAGDHIRVDSALCAGYEVGLHYEPLLAKVMAWGETREDSIKGLLRALLCFRAEGITCNTSLLRDVLASTEFAESTHHTGSMATWLEAGSIRAHHPGVTGTKMKNGNEKSGRETAAAIAVAMALASKNAFGAPTQPANQWRAFGRREQLQSRSLVSRSRR
jgi:acetyl/propionyl-CoA carboxylase alpha subunit